MATKRGRRRTPTENFSPVRTLERGLRILEALANMPNLTITEIANEVNLSASTVYRLVETLRLRDFVNYEEVTGEYAIGVEAFKVGSAFLLRKKLVDAADVEMKALVKDINENVNLAIQDKGEAVYLHQVEGTYLVQMFTQVGARAPLHASGVGKVLLAWNTPETARDLLGRAKLTSFTPNTLTRLSEISDDLQRTRVQGYGIDNEERELGVTCIAAPIRDSSNYVVAALSVSVPTPRLKSHDPERLAEKVVAAANRVSRQVGWQA